MQSRTHRLPVEFLVTTSQNVPERVNEPAMCSRKNGGEIEKALNELDVDEG